MGDADGFGHWFKPRIFWDYLCEIEKPLAIEIVFADQMVLERGAISRAAAKKGVEAHKAASAKMRIEFAAYCSGNLAAIVLWRPAFGWGEPLRLTPF